MSYREKTPNNFHKKEEDVLKSSPANRSVRTLEIDELEELSSEESTNSLYGSQFFESKENHAKATDEDEDEDEDLDEDDDDLDEDDDEDDDLDEDEDEDDAEKEEGRKSSNAKGASNQKGKAQDSAARNGKSDAKPILQKTSQKSGNSSASPKPGKGK